MAPAEVAYSQKLGPHPSYIQVAKPFVFEQKIQGQIIATGANPQREDTFRLQGVQWIDDTRRALQLPVRTFDTAVIYYHKFRLVHRDTEYASTDAAAAALFAACKIEDTLKKSREILCAAHNLKTSSPSEHLAPDDSVFDGPSKTIIGLERLMLEASGFDYRNRYPQKYLIKLGRRCQLDKDVVKLAYKMMLDLYRTFAPLKVTSSAMSFACLELSCRLLSKQEDHLAAFDKTKWRVPREHVMEGMLDLLELYTHFQKATKLGSQYTIERFIGIRIALNQEAEELRLPRFGEWSEVKGNGAMKGLKTPKTPITPASPSEVRANGKAAGDVASPATLSPRSGGSGRRGGARGQEGTVRFMLDGVQARSEKEVVAEYFRNEFEEYEVEVEEEMAPRALASEERRREDRRDGRNGQRDGYRARHERGFKRPRR
ncbi:hypothetical protein VF21_02841 [Pseudogymnoascus sp. 05NY08]|nr:hypothetical protein VF21_02841 [Pseudogymnoascus sp. 05NY08]